MKLICSTEHWLAELSAQQRLLLDGVDAQADPSLHLDMEMESTTAEEIRCIFDDNSKIIFVKSS